MFCSSGYSLYYCVYIWFLEWIKEVRENENIEGSRKVSSEVQQDEAEKGEVAGGEGDQALVECGFHDRVAQDDDGQDVAHNTEQTQTWDQNPLDKCFGINLKKRLFLVYHNVRGEL